MTRLEIFEYDPNWPQMYKEEAEALIELWKDNLVSIHHVGSTSVPGLAAKPIIDSMLIIINKNIVKNFDTGMEGLGYRPRGECLDAGGTPERYYYSKDTDGLRSHQAHIMQEGHFDILQKLNFRNYLRAHLEKDPTEETNLIEDSSLAREIAELKSGLIKWAEENGDARLVQNGKLAYVDENPLPTEFRAGVMGWRFY